MATLLVFTKTPLFSKKEKKLNYMFHWYHCTGDASVKPNQTSIEGI